MTFWTYVGMFVGGIIVYIFLMTLLYISVKIIVGACVAGLEQELKRIVAIYITVRNSDKKVLPFQ